MKYILAFAAAAAAAFILQAADTAVTLYTLPGCGRSAYAVEQLKKKGIAHTVCSIKESGCSSRMWSAVRATGKYSGGSIRMPVIVIAGKTYFNIADLQAFMESVPSLASGGAKPEGDSRPPAQDSFASGITERHNYYRKKHGVPDLRWNQDVQKQAQDWANRLAREGRMYHRQPNRYGENIFYMSGGEVPAGMAVDYWYAEIKDYNYRSPGFSMKTGHFTQVVWRDSTELGCGRARSAGGAVFVVCNYSPPGNYSGRFEKNVPPVRKDGGNESASLNEYIYVWTNGGAVVNRSIPGWTKKKLPIVNHYRGADNWIYVAVYSHNASGSVYPVGGGIYVMGLIRMKGTWKGRIAEPEGLAGRDISAAEELKVLARRYFPACKNDGWVGGDTGGFFGRE